MSARTLSTKMLPSPMEEDNSIHVRLRRATRNEHRRLDRGLAYVLSNRLSKARYVDLQAALYGFYAPLEDSISTWDAASPPLGLPFIRRAHLLGRDLHVLGRAAEQIPTCVGIPIFTTLDQVAGAIYVIEGASLGGQVIARAVMRRLGIGRENGAAFFTGGGAQTTAHWQEVLAWLEERGRLPAARDDLVAGASGTFGALTSWLLAREVLDE